MYCPNCGNKLDEDMDVCLKCGRFIIKNKKKKIVSHNKGQGMGIASMILAMVSLFISLRVLFYNHAEFEAFDSSVTTFFYLFSCLFIELVLGVVALVLSLISRREKSSFFNFVGLFGAMISFCVMAIVALMVISYR